MNKRDKYWFKNLLIFIFVLLIFISVTLYNIIQFNASYMQEEREELNIFQKQIEWAVKPYLERGDFSTVKKYCEDFYDEDVKFRIFDKSKKLIASSNGYTDEPIMDVGSRIFNLSNGKLKTYKNSLKNKMIGVVHEIDINDNVYYLELTISEEDVLKSIMHAQQSIWIFFIGCLIFFILGLVYVLNKLRVPFDSLENSVVRIANGDLDTNIDVPDSDILQELALSVKKMTQRLKQQIIRLKQLEEYKTDFINNVSHEIKTPITAINSAVELIESQSSAMSEQDRECLNIISYQVRFINTLINDILSLAEIEAEKNIEEKSFKKLNLNEIVEKIINYTNTSIPINLIQETSIEIYGDEELISRAVLNIITNADKYSNSPKIDIKISQEADSVLLEIRDYGIGIEQKHLERIFERFYRVDKARSRKSGGTGLGLAIVKNIIQLHSGSIEVESETGKGCNFIIRLPRIY